MSEWSFNPLHCGAVVASHRLSLCSNSFRTAFQSPSLRGSGRFGSNATFSGSTPGVSIPFIAGQWSLHAYSFIKVWRRQYVSIPFIAGQWSLRSGSQVESRSSFVVSIPFIAGQWSLQYCCSRRQCALLCFNPLHCGAVVASRLSTTSPEFESGFNPLHCGAVVASRGRRRRACCTPALCFNPLHCGAVVASRSPRRTAEPCAPVSIPFIAGQWSLPEERAKAEARARVSIPFIAGQWSLLRCRKSLSACLLSWFQSPSLRGSGRFLRRCRRRFRRSRRFQSPSLRGSGRFRSRGPFPNAILSSFNPLHCGAVVASYVDQEKKS